MLCNGAKVRILRSGATTLVQDLEPGELIFDPLHDCYRVIEDIHIREITGEEIASGDFDSLRPIFIPDGAFGEGRPKFGVRVSPCQTFVVCRNLKGSTGGHKSIFEISAAQLLSEGNGVRERFPEHVRFQYYFLLFEETACIEVNGALLTGMDMNNIVTMSENRASSRKAHNLFI